MSEDKKDSVPILLRDMGSGPILGISYTRHRRELVPGDFRRMNIGPAYQRVKLENVQGDKVKKIILKYMDNIHEMLKACTGFVLTGLPGVGKSAIAALLAQEVVRNGYTAYRTTHEEMQTLRFDEKKEFEKDGQLLLDRIKTCDFLILDNFNENVITDKIFDPIRIENLISHRNSELKSTVFTTRITPGELKENIALKSMYGTMEETMLGLHIKGSDLRQNNNSVLRKRLIDNDE